MKTVILSRKQLFEEVWTTPMRTLAHRYGLSDVGLAKVCQRHDIPLPPVGYWAKKEIGKAPAQTPLPRNNDPKIQQIKLWDGPKPEPAPEPPQEYDQDIQAMLDRAMSLTPVTVASTLHNLHPLIRRTRKALERQTYELHGLVSASGMRTDPIVEITVAKSNVRRALLFMDALFKAVEKVGGTIKIEKLAQWQPDVAVIRIAEIVIGGVRLRERYKQVRRMEDGTNRWTYPSHDYHPTGRFVLDHAPPSYDKPFCEDGEKSERSIEGQINKVIIKWINEAGQTRIRQRQEEEARRIRAEQERIRQEREADLKHRRDELIRQQKTEQSRVDQLLNEAESWQRSQVLRSYLAAIEDLLAKRPQPSAADSETAAWIRWAHQQADRLDPLKLSPASILDQKVNAEQ